MLNLFQGPSPSLPTRRRFGDGCWKRNWPKVNRVEHDEWESSVRGSEIVAEGTPEVAAEEPRSFTGVYLKPMLARGQEAEWEAAE